MDGDGICTQLSKQVAKQYKVAEGEFLKVEKLEGEIGDSIEFAEVLMVGGEKTLSAHRSSQALLLQPKLPYRARARKFWYSNPRNAVKTHANFAVIVSILTVLKIEKITRIIQQHTNIFPRRYGNGT